MALPNSHFVASFNLSWTPIAGGDFNGDGTTDVMWQNGAGLVAEWFMGNGTRQGTMTLQNMAGFTFHQSGDFNGDGTDDVLWWGSGILGGEWLMNNGAIAATQIAGISHYDSGPVAVGDYNADGISDYAWLHNHPAGQVAVGANGPNGRLIGTFGPWFIPGWTAIANGDFNGDGSTDILWANRDGLVAEWFMANGVRQGTATIQNMAGWTMIADGDFNADGTDDLMWRNADGLTAVWFMQDGRVGQTRSFGSTAGNRVVADGDFNSDGVADVMWQDTTTGVVNMWEFDDSGLLI